MSEIIRMTGRGLRGEGFGDVARRLGEIGGITVPVGATDAEILALFYSTLGQVVAAEGYSVIAEVVAATTANITLSGAQTIDGVAVVAGNRVLVKNQSSGAANGIYVAASGSWTRATDFDQTAEVVQGAYVRVMDGATQAGAWVLVTTGTITVGTTAQVWNRFDVDAMAILKRSGGSSNVGWLQSGTGADARTVEDKLRDTIHLDDYLASGDTSDDDAFARAITRLIALGGGVCELGPRTHTLTDGPIDLDTGDNNVSIIFKGKGLATIIEQEGATFPVVKIGETMRLRNSGLRDLILRSTSGAGPVIEVGGEGFEWLDLTNVDLEQNNTGGRLLYAPSGNMFYLRANGYWRAASGATVSPVYIRTQDTTFNHNRFDITGYNAGSAPFFDIENEDDATWLHDNEIKAVFQNCPGGGIRFANARAWNIRFDFWDLSPDTGYTGHLVHSDSNAGYESGHCHIAVERHGSGMTGAFRDVYLEAGQDFHVTCLTDQADDPIYDWANKRVTVHGRAYDDELNFDNREQDRADQRIFVIALGQNLYGDVLHIGGLVATEKATIQGVSGFVEFKTIVNGTGILLNARSGSATEHKMVFAADGASFYPLTDNFTSLGLSSNRYSVVYAQTGTINTSDEREKDWRGALTEDEIAAAKEIGAAIGVYRWLDAIAEKGEDARLHVGVKTQQVIEIMEAHSLDPTRYGFVCFDEWDAAEAVIDPGDPERVIIPAREAGNRYGIRYDELAMFLAAATEQRLSALELS